MLRRDGWWVSASAIVLALLCWQVPAAAQSARPAAQARAHKLNQVETEASMVLTGRLDVAADGRVTSHVVDDRESVPGSVLRYLDAQVARWRVEWGAEVGQPVAATLPFSVRLVAAPDGDAYRLRVASTLLGDMPGEPAMRVRARGEMKPPVYPLGPLKARAGGTVYVLLKVNGQGRVEDTLVEQVNLDVVAYPAVLEKLRRQLSEAALDAAREWTWEVPVTGPDAGRPHWAVRVPVAFFIQGDEAPYGQWAQYVPGERRFAEWADYPDRHDGIDGEADARPRLVGSGPRLVRDEAPKG